MVVALTGGIACGKSTVAQMLKQCGAYIVDADEISRGLTAPGGAGLKEVRRVFGPEVFAPDGTLDRAALGQIVFGNDGARHKLNAALHPLIRQEMERQTQAGMECGAQVVVLDVPLLFEAGMQDMAQLVACVHCPEEIQILRMKSRNGYSREEALSRIRSQWPLSEKMRLSDLLISTNQPLEDLRHQVQSLYESWV